METGAVQDLYIPPQGARGAIHPHAIITLPQSSGGELLLCYDSESLAICLAASVLAQAVCTCHEVIPPISDEGVYVNTSGGQIKDIRLQWGEVPSSIGMRNRLFVLTNAHQVCRGLNSVH